MKLNKGSRLGYLLAMLSVLIFSTNTPIARSIIAGAGMHPVTLSTYRFVLTAVLFVVLLSVSNIGRPRGGQLPMDGKAKLICMISGGINGVTIVAWYSALQTLDASFTAVLGVALFPIITLVFLAFGGESITRKKVIRVGIVLVGLYFLVGVSGELSGIGLLYVGFAAVTYAMHVVSVQWYMRPYNKWMTNGYIMTGSAVVVAVMWVIGGRPTFVPGWRGWVVILYQVFVLNFIGRTAMYSAIDRIGSGQMALATPLETVLTIVWSVVFLSERFAPNQWFGAGLIIVSALMAVEFRRRKPAKVN